MGIKSVVGEYMKKGICSLKSGYMLITCLVPIMAVLSIGIVVEEGWDVVASAGVEGDTPRRLRKRILMSSRILVQAQ
jgi:hypothetical protein